MSETALLRSLGRREPSASQRDFARETIGRIMIVLYDMESELSSAAYDELQKLIGGLIEEAQVRITEVLINEIASNLYYVAKRNGGGDDERQIPISGVSRDFFLVTGGRKFGKDQWVIKGTIQSTGEEASLFVSPKDERIKEMIIYEEPSK